MTKSRSNKIIGAGVIVIIGDDGENKVLISSIWIIGGRMDGINIVGLIEIDIGYKISYLTIPIIVWRILL